MRWPIQSASHCRRISSVSPGLPRDAVENREFIGHTSMAPLDGNEEHASLKSKKRRAQYCTVLITVPPSEVIRSVHAIRGDTRRPTLPYLTVKMVGRSRQAAPERRIPLHPTCILVGVKLGRMENLQQAPAERGRTDLLTMAPAQRSWSSPPRLCHGGNGSDSLAFSKGVRRR